MSIPEVLDAVIKLHGNRDGLSLDWLITTWLAFILSQAYHRMSGVEPWAAEQMESLSALLPQPVRVKIASSSATGIAKTIARTGRSSRSCWRPWTLWGCRWRLW